MADLFADAGRERLARTAPLPERLRPRRLEDLAGQQHVLAEGSSLRRAIEEDRTPSLILHGPPGVGKTTLARIVAESTGAAFEELSAVSARVDDVRSVIRRAQDRVGGSGQRTILFLDEIHRFNKAQQDVLLPAIEDGRVTLIGATTENPYVDLNTALLSRCTVIELESLGRNELLAILGRGAELAEIEIADDVAAEIARRAGGDARRALSILELAWAGARSEDSEIEPRHVADAAQGAQLRYDRDGDQHFDFTSAFIKSMRGSDPDAALYYLAAMLEAGEDPRFVARRMVVLASEDIGNADPQALLVAVAAAQALALVGLPEARLNLAQAATYLARAPKSNAVIRGLGEATSDVREHGNLPPPPMLRDTHYRGAARRGHGEGYVYPHDDPAGFDLPFLPEQLRGREYYRPSGNGEEGRRDDRDG